MKSLIAIVALSCGLGIGTTACAHQQLSNRDVAKAVLGTASIAIATSLVVMAISAPTCSQCNVDIGVAPH